MEATTTRVATDLYHEVRGSGPAVLLVTGAGGDGEAFARTAERLADEFTVITYDRRGNSRSTAGADGPAAATMAAQADDAALLVRACGFSEAVVFGTSGGAEITLELLARDPAVVRAAIIHEPPLISLLPPMQEPSPLEPILQLAETDSTAAMEAFMRANASDSAWEATDPATRERTRANGANFFARELEQFLAYRPDPEVLRRLKVPVVLMRSRDGLPFAEAVQSWLEKQLGVKGGTLTGHHAPYLDMPELLAEELRPILHSLWS